MPCVGFYMMHICNIYPAINWFWIICSFHLNLNEDSEVMEILALYLTLLQDSCLPVVVISV